MRRVSTPVKLLIKLFLLISLSGLTAAAVVGHQSPDLSGIKGSDGGAATVGDILDLLEQAAIKRSAPIEITEGDLNRYLAATVIGTQGDRTAEIVRFERVLVDLRPGIARVVLCWSIRGHRSTSSIDVHLMGDGTHHRAEIVGGSYGRMGVARGVMQPVLPAFEALAEMCDAEIKALFKMTKIQMVEDKLVLDPRF